MKIALIVILLLVLAAVSALFLLGKKSQDGQAPGVVDGSLLRCPDKPNCVGSEHADDTEHFVEPIPIAADAGISPIESAASTITEMKGVIQQQTDDYIAATFESSIFGFVDDFELRMDADRGILHVRSASRVGYSDGGVNRDRVISFVESFNGKMEGAP